VCGIDASVRDRREHAGSMRVRGIDASVRDRCERARGIAHKCAGSKQVCGIDACERAGSHTRARDQRKCAGWGDGSQEQGPAEARCGLHLLALKE